MLRVYCATVALICLMSVEAFAKPIKVSFVSGLSFGNGAPGDLAKVIVSGTSENAQNASFEVTGDANTAFSIVLPTSAQSMTTGRGPSSDSILVDAFTSFPSATGVLSAAGSRFVFVGARRAALRLTQRAGDYTGNFNITVVY